MQGPYRPPPNEPDPALAALAAEGRRRRNAAQAEESVDRDRDATKNMRTAIGAYRGSTIKRVILAVMLIDLLAFVCMIVASADGRQAPGPLHLPVFFVALGLFFAFMFLPPLASEGAVAAERAWASSLPFRLDGYFDLLAAPPRWEKNIGFSLRWLNAPCRAPDLALMQSIIAAVDPGARVERVDENGAVFVTGAVSGSTGIRVNRQPVYRNHRLPKAVHDMVDRVLVTLHRSHAIADVKLHA